MPDSTPVSPVPSAASVSFSVDDALKIANMLGALTVAIVPAQAGLVTLVTGAAALLRNTILPAIANMRNDALSIAEQSTLAAESAAERARVGAPPAVIN